MTERRTNYAATIRRAVSEVFLGGLLAGLAGGFAIAPWIYDNEDWKPKPQQIETARTNQ